MSVRTLLAVTLAIAGVISAESGGLTAAAPEDPEVYKGETTAVVVDVVVRDRRGRPILDLQKSDFELLEDGVPQAIGDVTLMAPGGAGVSGRAAPSSSPGGQAATGVAPDAPTFLAMVFDQMSLDARAVAHKGALAYLEAPGGPNDFVGVFLADLSLQTIESFTNDPRRIRVALDRVASRAASGDFTLEAERSSRAAGSPTASAECCPPSSSAGAGGGPAAVAGALVAHAEQMWARLERDRQGFATTKALRALTSALGTLPGRRRSSCSAKVSRSPKR